MIRSILNRNRLPLTTRSRREHLARISGGEVRMIAIRLRALRRAIEMALQRMADVLGRLTRGMTLGVRALVIGPDCRIFLVKHSYVSGWHLPGGGLEPGETLSDALVRELREKGNIEPTAPPMLH